MALTIRDSTKAHNASTTSLACTTPTGTVSGDVIVACLGQDAADGTGFTPPDGTWELIEAGRDTGPSVWNAMYYKVLSASPAANYTFTFDGTANGFFVSLTTINPDGNTLAAVRSAISSTASGTSLATGAVTGAVDQTALICGWMADDSTTVSVDPSGMTLEEFNNGASADYWTYSQVNPGTGSITKTLTVAATTQMVAIAALFDFSVSGPVITVQPANDVGIISNGQSTVYTATATGTNVQAPTWSEDASPIADGGIYDIVTTGAGTSSCSSTLTITRTVKTGTPFDIKAAFTDDNGSTDTTTVTDTWWTGPTSTTYAPTDGSGETTCTFDCDFITEDNPGTAIEQRIPLADGDVVITLTTTAS